MTSLLKIGCIWEHHGVRNWNFREDLAASDIRSLESKKELTVPVLSYLTPSIVRLDHLFTKIFWLELLPRTTCWQPKLTRSTIRGGTTRHFQRKSSHFSAGTSGPRKSAKVGVPWKAKHLGMNWWEINFLGHYPELQGNLQGNHSFQYWSLANCEQIAREGTKCKVLEDSKTQIFTFWPQMVPGGQMREKCPSTFRVATWRLQGAQSDQGALFSSRNSPLVEGRSLCPTKSQKSQTLSDHIHHKFAFSAYDQGVDKRSHQKAQEAGILHFNWLLTLQTLHRITEGRVAVLKHLQQDHRSTTSTALKNILLQRLASSQFFWFDSRFHWESAVLLKWRIRHHRYLLWRLEQLWKNHAYGTYRLHASWCGFLKPPNSPPSILKDPGRLACRSPESKRRVSNRKLKHRSEPSVPPALGSHHQ